MSLARPNDVTSNEHQHNISVRWCTCTKGQVPPLNLAFVETADQVGAGADVTAIMVRVGFWQPLETQHAPSVTNIFGTSCAWQ